ncbi:MAG: C-GCAxxG-C-C family protein [Micrococcales bacterium]|nr:C-GCAxxG-C-C family protein [Micrococcales bacterium]MCL2666232.1 C-GCAxxG-C-C family protein [Micrococcales bacterium]
MGDDSRVGEVVESFAGGLYCSQAVLSAYCEEHGLDKTTARKLSCGLAAGMARLGSTCGAVTGAALVIGLKHGSSRPGDGQAVEETFALIQEFDERFVEAHGSTSCRDLLGVDLRHGDPALATQQVKTICPGLVKDAAEILESIVHRDDSAG